MPTTPTSRRRGSIYLLVLVTVTTVTVLGLASLSVVSSQRVEAESVGTVMDARAAAERAIDLALAIMNDTPDWRWSLPNGDWRVKASLGNATYTINVVDPEDGVLSNDPCKPVLVTAYGFAGTARSIIRVRAEAEGPFEGGFGGIISQLSPISYWQLHEVSGTTMSDTAGERDGTYRNGVMLARRTGLGCTTVPWFDGENDFAEVSHRGKYELSQGSISLWCRPELVTTRRGVISKAASGFGSGGYFEVFIDASRIRARVASNAAWYTVRSDPISAGEWCHIVLTFGDDLKLYVNGVLHDTTDFDGGIDKNKEPIAIGVSTINSSSGSTNGWTSPFRGSITQVALFPTILDSTQVADLYAAYPPPLRMRVVSTSWERTAD